MLDFKIDKQFLQTHTMSFKVPYSDPKTYNLAEDLMLEFEGEFYFISSLTKTREDNEAYVEVVANALWYRLGERKYIGRFLVDGKTPEQGLTAILAAAEVDGLSWDVGLVSASQATYTMDVTDASYLDLIFQWAKICSCEVDFLSGLRRVEMIETLGADYGLSFRYRRNLTSITRVAVPPQVTRLYAYGRLDLAISGVNPSGEEYLEDYSFYTAQGLTLPEATALYRKDEVYKDDSFVEELSLYNAAVTRLAALSQPTISYSAKVLDISTLTGYEEASFGMGDRIVVEDEILGISVITRVVRYVRYPYEPNRNEVELAFIPVTLPDPNVSTGRADSGLTWELFEHRNDITPLEIRNGTTLIHHMPLRAQQDAEWACHFTLHGTAVGASTMTFVPFDPITGLNWWPTFTRTYTDGQPVEVELSFADKEIAEGRYIFAVRVYSDTAGAGISVVSTATSLWVLARGVVEETLTYDNSVVYSYTGAVQRFTVPDDVYQIRVEAHGSQGNFDNISYGGGGKGGKVVATFGVIPGEDYDVYVAGSANRTSSAGNWPNGGDGDPNSGSNGYGGGAATYLVPLGEAITGAYIVAAGGGGAGQHFIPVIDVGGGQGGYLLGGPGRGHSGEDPINSYPSNGARGATQTIPGIGGFDWGGGSGPWVRTGETGDTDGVGQGGDAGNTTNAFAAAGGGGGGGWHGGGGAGLIYSSGDKAGGGGGGSGYVNTLALDLETEDGENSGNGSMTISWADPSL